MIPGRYRPSNNNENLWAEFSSVAYAHEILSSVTKESQRVVYSKAHSMIYASSAEQFDKMWDKLGNFLKFRNYLHVNWLLIKSW